MVHGLKPGSQCILYVNLFWKKNLKIKKIYIYCYTENVSIVTSRKLSSSNPMRKKLCTSVMNGVCKTKSVLMQQNGQQGYISSEYWDANSAMFTKWYFLVPWFILLISLTDLSVKLMEFNVIQLLNSICFWRDQDGNSSLIIKNR